MQTLIKRRSAEITKGLISNLKSLVNSLDYSLYSATINKRNNNSICNGFKKTL